MEISQDELSQINEEEDWVVDSVNSEALLEFSPSMVVRFYISSIPHVT